MSSWHRDHPELCGTDADPAMANPSHRKAYESLIREGHVDPPEGMTREDYVDDGYERPSP